jgi:hypothetical protein
MNTLIVDPVGGISGDMLLAGLMHLGCPAEYLREIFAVLNIGPFQLHTKADSIHGISCLGIMFEIPESRDHRTYASIRDEILTRLPERIGQLAGKIFLSLAEAEAEVHGCTVDEVHFHELGAVDSILDVVGISAALDRLGVERIYTRPVPLGSGWVNSLHGKIPVPAPATVKLLEGIKVRFTQMEAEISTPTGAAVLKALAERTDPPSDLIVSGVGYGCGSKRFPNWPNLCRVILCEESHDREGLRGYLAEADIDDMPAEDMEAALEQITGAGALDVTITQRIMKRGRPGMGIKAICDGAHLQDVLNAILLHTTTIGVRYHAIERSILPRRFRTVSTRYGNVTIKEVTAPDGGIRSKPEFRDLYEISRSRGISLSELRKEVEKVMHDRRDDREEP